MLYSVTRVAVSSFLLIICLVFVSGVELASAEGKALKINDGAPVLQRGIVRVEKDDGRITVQWGGEQVLMRPSFTLNVCGNEITPTLKNLEGLVGKDCRADYEEVAGDVEVKRVECSCSR